MSLPALSSHQLVTTPLLSPARSADDAVDRIMSATKYLSSGGSHASLMTSPFCATQHPASGGEGAHPDGWLLPPTSLLAALDDCVAESVPSRSAIRLARPRRGFDPRDCLTWLASARHVDGLEAPADPDLASSLEQQRLLRRHATAAPTAMSRPSRDDGGNGKIIDAVPYRHTATVTLWDMVASGDNPIIGKAAADAGAVSPTANAPPPPVLEHYENDLPVMSVSPSSPVDKAAGSQRRQTTIPVGSTTNASAQPETSIGERDQAANGQGDTMMIAATSSSAPGALRNAYFRGLRMPDRSYARLRRLWTLPSVRPILDALLRNVKLSKGSLLTNESITGSLSAAMLTKKGPPRLLAWVFTEFRRIEKLQQAEQQAAVSALASGAGAPSSSPPPELFGSMSSPSASPTMGQRIKRIAAAPTTAVNQAPASPPPPPRGPLSRPRSATVWTQRQGERASDLIGPLLHAMVRDTVLACVRFDTPAVRRATRFLQRFRMPPALPASPPSSPSVAVVVDIAPPPAAASSTAGGATSERPEDRGSQAPLAAAATKRPLPLLPPMDQRAAYRRMAGDAATTALSSLRGKTPSGTLAAWFTVANKSQPVRDVSAPADAREPRGMPTSRVTCLRQLRDSLFGDAERKADAASGTSIPARPPAVMDQNKPCAHSTDDAASNDRRGLMVPGSVYADMCVAERVPVHRTLVMGINEFAKHYRSELQLLEVALQVLEDVCQSVSEAQSSPGRSDYLSNVEAKSSLDEDGYELISLLVELCLTKVDCERKRLHESQRAKELHVRGDSADTLADRASSLPPAATRSSIVNGLPPSPKVGALALRPALGADDDDFLCQVAVLVGQYRYFEFRSTARRRSSSNRVPLSSPPQKASSSSTVNHSAQEESSHTLSSDASLLVPMQKESDHRGVGAVALAASNSAFNSTKPYVEGGLQGVATECFMGDFQHPPPPSELASSDAPLVEIGKVMSFYESDLSGGPSATDWEGSAHYVFVTSYTGRRIVETLSVATPPPIHGSDLSITSPGYHHRHDRGRDASPSSAGAVKPTCRPESASPPTSAVAGTLGWPTTTNGGKQAWELTDAAETEEQYRAPYRLLWRTLLDHRPEVVSSSPSHSSVVRGNAEQRNPSAVAQTRSNDSHPADAGSPSSSMSRSRRQVMALPVASSTAFIAILRRLMNLTLSLTVNGASGVFDLTAFALAPRGFVPLIVTLRALPDVVHTLSLAKNELDDRSVETLSACITGGYFGRLVKLDVSDNPKVSLVGGQHLLTMVTASGLLQVACGGTNIRGATRRTIELRLSKRRAVVAEKMGLVVAVSVDALIDCVVKSRLPPTTESTWRHRWPSIPVKLGALLAVAAHPAAGEGIVASGTTGHGASPADRAVPRALASVERGSSRAAVESRVSHGPPAASDRHQLSPLGATGVRAGAGSDGRGLSSNADSSPFVSVIHATRRILSHVSAAAEERSHLATMSPAKKLLPSLAGNGSPRGRSIVKIMD